MYLYYVLTMGVFTTSWWVVNQPIVVVMFLIASIGLKLLCPTLGGVKPLFLHIVLCLYPTIGGVTLYDLCRYYCFYRFSYSREMFPCIFLIVWGPRVCRHGDYKRIGHAEILNFRT